jgi:hypothetical protein
MRHFILKAASGLACAGIFAFTACNNTTTVGGGATGTSGTGGVGGAAELPKADKVDILFMIDNSRSMADKQQVIALALTDLVQSLVNPPCLNASLEPIENQPESGLDPCPAGSVRAYEAVNDIHIGVVSSSIGGHGSDSCPDQENGTCVPAPNFTNNDKGHLLDRVDACGGGSVPTYQGFGFLAWDPTAKLTPPGESDRDVLAQSFKEIVLGAGQIGCGYEAPMESWYRFLVDPEPYQSISVIENKAQPEGLDQTVLDQRAAFLRPDSLLAIVMLSDENDCSTKEFGQFFFANQLKNSNGTPFHLPRARAICATDPNNECCRSCGQDPGGCPDDPTCYDGGMPMPGGAVLALSDDEDQSNLRCFDQKRRFGIDFLNPVDRYIQALTSTMVPNRIGELVQNPIFAGGRDPRLVVLAGIIGVPWQDIARDKADLTQGYKNADELATADNAGKTTWDIILGDPAAYVPPLDPLMIESVQKRAGTNPITGDAIATAQAPLANPINGHDYTIAANDDLQYACIFELPEARDCEDQAHISCDCKDPANDSPICATNPNSGEKTLQTHAKAYPGTRQLSVIKGVDGVVSSVCPAQLTDNATSDFGYRPAMRSLIERLQTRL